MLAIEPRVTQAGRWNKEPIRKLSYYLVMNANVGATPERLPFSFASSGVIFKKKKASAASLFTAVVQQLSHRPHPLPHHYLCTASQTQLPSMTADLIWACGP